VQGSNIKAALLVMVAMSMITTNDAIVKHLTQVFGIGQIMLIRGLLVCIIFAAFLKASNIPVLSKKMFHRWNIIRGLLELGATAAFLTGLSMLPLATASSLGFSSPIFLAVLAAIFLLRGVASYLPFGPIGDTVEPFRTLNIRYYGPLILSIGVGYLSLLLSVLRAL
jgi:drug/metabolite transporter (DMT)-like permease